MFNNIEGLYKDSENAVRFLLLPTILLRRANVTPDRHNVIWAVTEGRFLQNWYSIHPKKKISIPSLHSPPPSLPLIKINYILDPHPIMRIKRRLIPRQRSRHRPRPRPWTQHVLGSNSLAYTTTQPKNPGSSSGAAPKPRKRRSLGPLQEADVLPSQALMRDRARSLTALWIGIYGGNGGDEGREGRVGGLGFGVGGAEAGREGAGGCGCC